MKQYELTYLISTDINEEGVDQLQTKIISLIQKEEGILVEKKLVFKKKLAYPVKKYSQAFLATIYFQLLPEKITTLEKALKEEKEILRYLILIKLPTKKMKPARVFKKLLPEKTKKEKKVDLDKFEKKLEEILEE